MHRECDDQQASAMKISSVERDAMQSGRRVWIFQRIQLPPLSEWILPQIIRLG
jgi:hypothetical protein